MRYAPVILVSSIFGLAVSFAPIFNMAVFLKPLVQEFGWTRTQVAAGGATATLALAVSAPYIGRIIDIIGPRRLIIGSSAAFACSIALLATLPAYYPVFLLLAALVGVTGAGTTPLAYLALVARWFDGRLGLAMGIAMVGVGVGLAASPLIGSALLAEFGLRGTFLGMAAIAALAVPNAIFILRDRAGAVPKPAAAVKAVRPATYGFATIIRVPTFWFLALSVFMMTVVAAGCGVHMIALLTDRGYQAHEAAAVASTIGLALLAGRLLSGFLLDYVPIGWLGAATFLLGAAGVALLGSTMGGFVPILAACLIGFAQGAEGDLMAYAVRRCFGLDAYGLTYGMVFAAFNFGAFAGPVIMGLSFDHLGSYGPGLSLFTALALGAAFLVFLVRPPRQSELSYSPA